MEAVKLSFSVVILSKKIDNLIPCMVAVRANEPDARIIVIDDGLSAADKIRLNHEYNTEVFPGKTPFVHSVNANIGIRAADEDDVVLLNDDALLQTPGGFTLLWKERLDHQEYGIISSTCNMVGNRNQWPMKIGLRSDPRMVCFVCVLIPRRTIEAVGMLDESFTCYSHNDDDYCIRVRKAGLKIGIHDGCYVDHKVLRSTFRPNGGGGDLSKGSAIFKRKWGNER